MDPRPDPHASGRRTTAKIAAALFGVSAVAESTRILFGWPWPGLSPGVSHTVSVLLIALWVTGAVTFLRQREHSSSAQLAWSAGMLGVLALIVHAGVTRVLGSWMGIAIYLPIGLVLAWLFKRAFDRGEFHRLRDAIRAEERAHARHRAATARSE